MTVFDEAVKDIFDNDDVAVDADYTPTGEAAVPCRIIINRDVLLQPTGMDAQVVEQGIIIEAILADIGQEPNRGDIFETDTETFTVQSIESNDGRVVKVIVT